MARFGQDEGLVLRTHLGDAAKARLPGGDMVGLAGHRAKRHLHALQRDRLAADLVALVGEPVLLAQPAQVFDRHLRRQVGAVAVPVEQIERRRRLAQHVAADRRPVDQVVRAQVGEGARHEEPMQEALFLDLGLQPVDEIVRQEHADLALVREIGERGEEGGRLDRPVAPRLPISASARLSVVPAMQ
jgi:hypothetical protein